MKRIFAGSLIAVSLAFALSLAGCELPFVKSDEPAEAATPQPDLIPPVQFKGIPIPYEFELLPDESWSHVAPSFRTGVMNYRGDILLSRAKSFFAQEMPAAGWTLLQLQEPSRAAAVMKFAKGEENCVITLRRAGGITYLTVEISE